MVPWSPVELDRLELEILLSAAEPLLMVSLALALGARRVTGGTKGVEPALSWVPIGLGIMEVIIDIFMLRGMGEEGDAPCWC